MAGTQIRGKIRCRVNQFAEINDPLNVCFSCGIGEIARHFQVAVGIALSALLAMDEIIRDRNILHGFGQACLERAHPR